MPIKFQALKDKASIEAVLGNLPPGDAVVLDIDNTLFRNVVDKYGDGAPKPTEKNLSTLFKYLRETGHPVILLTARKESYRDISLKQLEQLGFEFDTLLHAPSQQVSAVSNTAMKGKVLADYLSDKDYRRLHVIDDKLKQLKAIAAALQESEPFRDLKSFLYHYQPTSQLLQTNEYTFPETLNGLTEPKSLGGGTESTYQLHDSEGRRFVLKHGDSEDQIKIEILMNSLYKTLGVPVAEVQGFDVIPAPLAKAIKLPHTAQTVQLAEFVQAAEHQDDEKIKAQARRDFVIHAFMGNIDITKTDNFIQTASGDIKLIDAGANFIFRAKGERRDEVAATVEELQTLRDEAHNASGAIWFQDLSDTEIEAQVKALIEKRDTIEETLWTLSRDLELPASLQRQLINGFSHRLDGLAQLYGFTTQRFTKRDKGAIAGKTAAGVMHLQRNDQGELCVLLSKRVRHNWCDNFGGKSDVGDETLAFTAQRECKEESNGELQYSDKELADAPFHDIVTTTSEGQTLYRMYFVEANEALDISQLNDPEHTEHHWLPLSQLQVAIQANEQITEEGKPTIKVSTADNEHIIFPPLYDMLKQAPVQTLIDGLVKGSPAITRTQGLASMPEQEASTYKPLTSTERLKADVTATVLKKAGVLDDIKHHRHQFFATRPAPGTAQKVLAANSKQLEPDESTVSLSPSELHLQTVMGDDFRADARIENNVALFLEKYSPIKPQGQEKERLIRQAVEMIGHERENPDSLFFYHGVNHDIAYAYSVYTELYRLLEADSSLNALRTDNALFHSCLDIQSFIAHFESLGNDGKVYNYNTGYMECALSVNPFLFGSHNVAGSNTITYYIDNNTASEVDIKDMFEASLQCMGVSEGLINRITRLHQLSDNEQFGRLYQMAIPKDYVDNYAYAAAPGGRLNPLVAEGKESTTKMTEVINALCDGSAETDYIAELQARVMVPPNAPVRAKMYVWSEKQKPDKSTTSQLKRLAKDMAHDILKHRNQFNKLNFKSALARYLPDILRQAGLSADDAKITDELLVQLIKNADFESITVIVKLHPEYKEKKLDFTTLHYTDRTCQLKANINSTLLELLLDIPNSGETIRAIFGDTFYEGKLDQLNIVQVVKALPMGERLDFAHKNQGKIQSGDELAVVLNSLPEDVRLDFAITYRDKIQDAYELTNIINSLPESTRLNFATGNQDKIENGDELVIVLNSLPESAKLYFAQKNQGKIENAYELVVVLNSFPESARVGIVTENQDKIENGGELVAVLNSLPESARVCIVTENQSIIRNGDELAKVLKVLPESTKVDIVTENQGKIRNGNELANIINNLPESTRLYFAIEHQGKIRNAYELGFVLACLPEKSKIDFATENQDKIGNTDELIYLLDRLPESAKLDFAIEHRDKIGNVDELGSVLIRIPETSKIDFARKYQDMVRNKHELTVLLSLLSERAKFEFAGEYQDKIRDVYELAVVLKSFPESVRLGFASVNQGKIQDAYELAYILSMLPKDVRLGFATENRDTIEVADELVEVLETLPRNARLGFATENQDKVHDADALADVLNSLPESAKLDFAREYHEKIRDADSLPRP